jgi:hypothetical protein
LAAQWIRIQDPKPTHIEAELARMKMMSMAKLAVMAVKITTPIAVSSAQTLYFTLTSLCTDKD